MNRRGYHRGLSLAEAIISVYVLVFAMLVSFALYDYALKHSVKIDRKHRAALVAARRIEEIRAWSRDHHGTNGDMAFSEGWGNFHNTSFPDPEDPTFTVDTTIETDRSLFSPSTEFEEVNFAAQEDENIPDDSTEKRELTDSSYLVTVTVTWGPGSHERIRQRFLVSDPVRDLGWGNANLANAIVMQYNGSATPPGILAMNDTVQLKAVVRDANGEEVENAVVQWYIDPDSSGNGTLESQPNTPTEATFTNRFEVDKDPESTGDELNVYPGGSVRIVARVRLGGREAIRKSPPIVLQN